MADFPLFGGNKSVQFGYDYVAARGSLVTSGALANTKGAFVELLSAADNISDSFSIDVSVGKGSATASNILVDIAIGEAGSEQVILPNLFHFTIGNNSFDIFQFPIKIPAGVRLSVRSQGDAVSVSSPICIRLQSGGFTQGSSLSAVEGIGLSIATTRGTLVVQAAVSYGSWVEMTASSTRCFKGFVISDHKARISSWSTGNIAYQVAIGPAGNEVVISDGNVTFDDSAETGSNFVSPFNNVEIPSGSRVSIRATAASTNGDFSHDFVLYGVY